MKQLEIEDQPNQSVAKALLLLDLFDYEQHEWGIRDLARETGMNPTTVYRLVKTLHNAGYLDQDSDSQRYCLGPKAMQLASLYMYRNPLPTVGAKVFQQYSDRFEHNFYLAILRNYEVIYLSVLDGRGTIKVAVRAGGTTDLHSTALGKILLAAQDDSYIHKFLERTPLVARTPRTITSAKELWAQIATVREVGFAVNNGEQFDEVAAIGVPVHNRLGEVIAGVSLAFPRLLLEYQRFQIENLIPLAREVADEIEVRSAEYFQLE